MKRYTAIYVDCRRIDCHWQKTTKMLRFEVDEFEENMDRALEEQIPGLSEAIVFLFEGWPTLAGEFDSWNHA